MSEDWAAVRSAISTRMRELGLTQVALAKRSQVSSATIREIQGSKKARQHKPRTLRSLSEALQWPGEYLGNVLNGRPPGEPAAGTEPQSIQDMLEQCLEKISALEQRLGKIDVLEERLDKIADVVYSLDSKFDVIIDPQHLARDR